jgi:hypothetical protein
MPIAAISGSTPTATRLASASSALATLCRPGSVTAASSWIPPGPYATKRCPYPAGSTASARQVARGCPIAEYVMVAGLISGRSAPSSRLITSCSQRPSNSIALAAKYSPTDGWKSRWSVPKLVYPPTAKWVPPTRPSVSAWLDTSIAMPLTPRSTATAKSACRSLASGVVRALSSTSPASRVSTVPTSPVTRPAARSPDSIRYTVEVFPAVPVIPRTVSFSVGRS